MSCLEKQYEVLQWAFSFLKAHQREEKVAEILLQHHLNVSRAAFFARMTDPVPASVVDKFKRDIKRHSLTGVPVQHLTGYEYFYGQKFIVNKHVLVPRFETEELVQRVIHFVHEHFSHKQITIVDVGTGSGVIAITLALQLPNATVYATDISKDALQVAKENAKLLEASVRFLEGDFLQPMINQSINPHVIVSNPPYIGEEERESLSDTVKNFDPELALFADHDGLFAYEKIITQIKSFQKKPKRVVCFEIGHTQAREVTRMMEQHLTPKSIETLKDMNGKDRIITTCL